MPNQKLYAVTALFLSLDAVSMQAGCIRHFTNRSNFSWSIAGYDGAQSKLIIGPNTTVEIPYGTADKITISGYIPNRPYTKQFQAQASDACYEILHQGNPGYISLNKTQNGDVVTCVGGC